MERLAKLCKKPRYLTFSQLIMFQKSCQEHKIKVIFIHKFLVKIVYQEENCFLKINPYDNEFFFISKKHSLKIFSSFSEFNFWFENEYIERCIQNE